MTSVTGASPSPLGLIVILVAISALNPMAINMFLPAMPNIVAALDTNLTTAQLVLSAYLFATAVAQLVVGSLSDRFGRRPVLIAGLVIFVASGVLCAMAVTIDLLVLGRIVQGAGGCVGIVLTRAIVRDLYERDRAASMLGYVTMGFAVAPMVSPAIGGVLDDLFGWRSIFAALAGLAALLIVVIVLWLPETRREAADPDQPIGLRSSSMILAGIPAFWAYALTCAFASAVFFAFLGAAPFIASGPVAISATEFGFYFMPVAGGYILGNLVIARLAESVGSFPLMITGSVILVLAIAGMTVAFLVDWNHPLAVFAPMYAVGISNGLTIATALAGAVSVRPDLAGAASGISGSMQVGFGAVAAVIVGALLGMTGSVLAMAACMMLFAVAGLLAAWWSRSARSG